MILHNFGLKHATRFTENSISSDDFAQKYKEYCRPKLGELLESLHLDKPFLKAAGNYLYYKKNENGTERDVPVLDLVGGYGTNLLGHNHPDLVQTMMASLQEYTPFTAQCASRSYAGVLAEKLNELIPGNDKYICNFTNSGTESVEAAIKHAYMVWCDTIERKATRMMVAANDLFNTLQRQAEQNPNSSSATNIEKIRQDILDYNSKQIKKFSKKGIICAFKGSFHGKTSSSVKITYNKTFRESFENLTTFQTRFIPIDKPEQLQKEYENSYFNLLYPVLSNDDQVLIKEEKIPSIFGFIMEVVIGEGGVIPIPDSSLEMIREIHNAYNIPLIIDEIQTGCGRTGSFFSYSNTPLKQLSPEYITLSKALGGGLVKIGATLINEKVYDPEFGLIHTSTFSEDEIACKVALEVLHIITRDHNELLNKTELKGKYFRDKLLKLKSKYPRIIKDVRGKGLMIGLEFTDLSKYSPFFKYAGTQGFIAMLVSSYIMEHHNIRLLSPLSTMFKNDASAKRSSVIRFQPSAYINKSEIDSLIEALDETLNVVHHNNEFVLLAHLIGYELTEDERKHPLFFKPDNQIDGDFSKSDIKLGFIVHITELDYLINHYLRSFHKYEFRRRSLTKWWDKMCRFLEPDLMYQKKLNIKNKKVEVNIICLPYLPKYMIRVYAEGQDKNNRDGELRLLEMQDKIQDAAKYAKHIGDPNLPVNIIGLGAYNSIVTENALQFNDLELPVTSGNAYTTALMYQGILKAIREREMDIYDCTVAVVGAGGNIGRAISELFSPLAKKLILIGRNTEAGIKKVEKVKNLCYKFIEPHMNRAYDKPENEPITVGTLDDVSKADIVVIATNSSDANLISPEKVKPGSIVCCASVPSNLSVQFKDHTDKFMVFDSGYAKLPDDNTIDFIGMPKDGLVYGCLAETILLALKDSRKSYAKGHITSEMIIETLNLADDHGFELGKYVLGDHIKRMVT
jgi:acetylornithine/succinyldiaminopimelate/putrescine aminotransferase/predicted amino acid dehydrogenase